MKAYKLQQRSVNVPARHALDPTVQPSPPFHHPQKLPIAVTGQHKITMKLDEQLPD